MAESGVMGATAPDSWDGWRDDEKAAREFGSFLSVERERVGYCLSGDILSAVGSLQSVDLLTDAKGVTGLVVRGENGTVSWRIRPMSCPCWMPATSSE